MKMITSEQVQLALNVGQLSGSSQHIYFKLLEDVLTEDEIKAFQVVVAFFRLKNNPHRENAMRKALAEELYYEFNKSKEITRAERRK